VTWPQASILVWLAFGAILASVGAVTERKLSSAGAMIYIFIRMLISVGVALVLHAGGFW
jgi:hypothetical protein